MARGIPLRDDFNVDRLRAVARSAGDAKQARRLLALSLIYDGGSRSEAARHANVSLQTVRDWVLRFNAKGADGLVDGKSTGTPPRLNAAQRTALARVVEDGAVNLTKAGRSSTFELGGSSSSGHGPPYVHRVTRELAHCLASDQMTLDIEGVVEGGVGGEKPLRRSW